MKQLTNAQFHDFKTTPLFVGTYTGEKLIRSEDDPKDKNKKKGDLMGYEFLDEEGMNVWVGASASIQGSMEPTDDKGKIKSADVVKKDTVVSFEFTGEGKTKAGRKFNKFRVIQFDSWEESDKYYEEKAKNSKEAF